MRVVFNPYIEDVDGRNKLTFPLMAKKDYDKLSHFDTNEMEQEIIQDLGPEQFEATLSIVPPKKIETTVGRFARNGAVKLNALKRANGKCQLCDQNGPFKYKQSYYLEVHHVKPLADGGIDDLTNVVALCPNCHRKVHMAPKPEYIEKMKKVCKGV